MLWAERSSWVAPSLPSPSQSSTLSLPPLLRTGLRETGAEKDRREK